MTNEEKEKRKQELRILMNEKQELILKSISELSILANELNQLETPKVFRKKKNGKDI